MRNKTPILILICALLLAGVLICWSFALKRAASGPAKLSSQTGSPMTRLIPADRFAVNNAPHKRNRTNSFVAQQPKAKDNSVIGQVTRYLNPQVTAFRWIEVGVSERR